MAVLQRRPVSQGLMRPLEVVFDEPFGQFSIENVGVGMEVAESDEFFLQGAVEPLVVGIVRGSSDARMVLLDAERVAGLSEILPEFRAVVMPDSGYLAIEQEMQTQEEILSVLGTPVLVHPGIGHLAVLVDAGEDVALETVPVDGNGIEADDVAGLLLIRGQPVELQFRDLLFLS